MSCKKANQPIDAVAYRAPSTCSYARYCSECAHRIQPGDEYVRCRIEHAWPYRSWQILCEYCLHDWRILSDLGYLISLGSLAATWRRMWIP